MRVIFHKLDVRTRLAADLVEEVEFHLLLLLLLRLGGRGRGRAAAAAAAAGGLRGSHHRGKCFGVAEDSLHLLRQGEDVVHLEGDRQEVLVPVDERVGHGGLRGVARAEGEGGDIADTSLELLLEVVLGDFENGRVVHGAILEDLGDVEAVQERLDVELGQQGGLRGAHALALGANLEVGGNFDGTLHNLGRDAKGLEERGLGGVQPGGAGEGEHVALGGHAHAGEGPDLVLLDLVLGLVEVTLHEAEADVTDEEVGDGEPLPSPVKRPPTASRQRRDDQPTRPPSRQKLPKRALVLDGVSGPPSPKKTNAWSDKAPTPTLYSDESDDAPTSPSKRQPNSEDRHHDPEADGFTAIDGPRTPCPFKIQVQHGCEDAVELDDLGLSRNYDSGARSPTSRPQSARHRSPKASWTQPPRQSFMQPRRVVRSGSSPEMVAALLERTVIEEVNDAEFQSISDDEDILEVAP